MGRLKILVFSLCLLGVSANSFGDFFAPPAPKQSQEDKLRRLEKDPLMKPFVKTKRRAA